MEKGREAHIIIDKTVTSRVRPLIELEALAAQAVALLACRAEAVSATLFCRPASRSYWLTLSDARHNFQDLIELKRQAPSVDFEVIHHPKSDLVSTG